MTKDNDFNELSKELLNLKRTQSTRITSLAKINARIEKKKFNIFPLMASVVLVISATVFLLFMLNDNNVTYHNASRKIPIVEVHDSLFTIDYSLENMDSGRYEYVTTNMRYKIIIDPEISSFRRGDVIYYNTPKYINGLLGIKNKKNSIKESLGINIDISKNQFSRIVGLPGETIKIVKGQVYINEKKLETFYSYPSVAGMNKTEYLKIADHRKSTLKTNSFDESMDTILIPEGTVFILGDQWWRSFDSRLFGPIPLDTILGKVMGRTEG